MKWNVSTVNKSPENSKYSPDRSVAPKPSLANSASRNRKVLMSKSSMMGVLGVVPEEDGSEDEEAQLNGMQLGIQGDSLNKKLRKSCLQAKKKYSFCLHKR